MMFCIFFFQAEDGIRDRDVTGVQTCALPIVTHALDMARQLCDRAAMLDHGLVHAIGAPDEVVREMRMTILKHDLEFALEEGTREIEILGGALLRGPDPLDGPLAPGESVAIH